MRNLTRWCMLLCVLLFAPDLWAQDFVVVKSNSKFFQTASSSKPFLHSKNEKGFLTLELLEEKVKRVHVKIRRNRKTCYSTALNLGYELYLWVNRKNLEKVTTDSLNWEFKDGSQVDLAAGMVVKRGKVITRNGSLRLKIPKEKIGFSFQKKYLIEPVSFSPVVVQISSSEIIIREKQRVLNVLTSKRGMRFNSNKYFRNKVFRNVEKKGELDEVKSTCIRVRGKLLSPKKFKGIDYHGGGAKLGGKKRHVGVIPGTLFTPKGEKIGKTDPRFSFPGKLETIADFFCKDLKIFASTKNKLCVNRTRMIRFHLGLPGTLVVFKISNIRMKGGDLAESKRVVGRKRNAIKYCYVKQLFTENIGIGNVTITAEFGRDGKVKSATITKSTMNSAAVKKCVVGVTKRFRLKKSKDEASINFRLYFGLEEI